VIATAANKPNPSLAPATGPRCLRCGTPTRNSVDLRIGHRCKFTCSTPEHVDLADAVALLFAVVAISAWGCL
jgi:hypothetical protein